MCDVDGCILTGEVVLFRDNEPGGESGESCEGGGRLINDLRGANNGVEVSLVGEWGGLIAVLVERAKGGSTGAEVDGLAGLVDRVEGPDALEDGLLLKELARRRPLALGVLWCPGADRTVNGGLYSQHGQI